MKISHYWWSNHQNDHNVPTRSQKDISFSSNGDASKHVCRVQSLALYFIPRRPLVPSWKETKRHWNCKWDLLTPSPQDERRAHSFRLFLSEVQRRDFLSSRRLIRYWKDWKPSLCAYMSPWFWDIWSHQTCRPIKDTRRQSSLDPNRNRLEWPIRYQALASDNVLLLSTSQDRFQDCAGQEKHHWQVFQRV